MSAKCKLTIRLPAEWQWAAIGNTDREYPWGNGWNLTRANQDEAGIGCTMAVGLYPLSRSPFGIEDMAGNVWQWCLNYYHYPTISCVIRGGSGLLDRCFVRSKLRTGERPTSRYFDLGFRVLCELPTDE